VSSAPILVLVAKCGAWRSASGAAAPDPGDSTILGLGLVQRAVLASRRAGYGRVFYLAPHELALPGITMIANWKGLVTALGTDAATPLVIAPARIVAETGWLEHLARTRLAHARWAAIPDRIVMLPAVAAREALSALAADDGARDLTAIQDRLVRCLGAPAALRDGIDPMVVAAPTDIRAAERRLLRALVKDSDGFMARHVERPISLAISRHLASTAVTPNQMTLMSVAVGLVGAPFFLSVLAPWQTVGALLLLAHSILDGCDGELARLKFQESRRGGILDFWGDNIVHGVTFACMAAGWSRANGAAWPLLLGASAVVATLASAGFVYWRVMRPKDDTGPLYTSVSTTQGRHLVRLLDVLSRRDFIYLVVAFALFGKANWFLALTALGAPTFLALLVILAARERAAMISARSGI
jgi:1L-myo-inositol 1-phosphate cytidylyltransferase / CDP-L-myo-inositol myo-inositolphosphotransferase